MVQGGKWTMFGTKRFACGAGQALAVGIETPAFGSITEATPARPYLGLVIEVDPGVMRDAMAEAPMPAGDRGGMLVTALDQPLAACLLRLVRLLATPAAIRPSHR